MTFFRLQAVNRAHQGLDSLGDPNEPLWGLLTGRQHRLVQAEVACDGIVRQRNLVGILSLQAKLWHRPMPGKAAMGRTIYFLFIAYSI
jgi:hypothetical protein